MFGQWLKNERLNRGMSQKELASELKLSYVIINKYENNHRFPSLQAQKKISKYFGISIEQLRKMEGK